MSPVPTLRLAAALVALLSLSTPLLSAQVWVDPDAEPGDALPNSSGNQAFFTVYNEGAPNEFDFTCSRVGAVTSCSVSPTSASLDTDEDIEVTVTFSTGSPGSGTLTLEAQGAGDWDDTGWYDITVWQPQAVLSVTPDGGSTSATHFTSGNQVSFTVTETSGQAGDPSISFSCTPSGAVTSCTPPPSTSVSAGGFVQVSVSFNTGAAGPGSVTLHATGTWNADNGSYNVTVNSLPGPIVQEWPAYVFEKRDYARCAVPGRFALIYSQSTVPYFSLDTPRNVTLVYNSDRVDPKPFVHVDVKRDGSYGQVPQKFQLEVKVNGNLVTFLNGSPGEQTLNFAYVPDGEFHRLGGQFDAAAAGVGATGIYPMEIIVTAIYPTSFGTTTIPTSLVVVNENSSPIASGWTVAGVQRLYPLGGGSALITEGEGSHTYFEWDAGSGTFLNPAAEVSRLTQVAGTWTRAYPDSTKVTFNSTGRMTQIKDRFNNQTTLEYDGSNRLWRITDPAGFTITLAYDVNGRLQSISDHWGRVTNVTVLASGTLTAIRDLDNVSTSFGYSGLRMTSVTDRRGYTTTFGYHSASGKLTSVTSPPVAVFGEAEQSLVTTYAPWDTAGVPYGPTGTPKTPPRWDLIAGEVTDPGGHVTRHTGLNHFRQADSTWLPLGLQILARYDFATGQAYKLTQPIGAIDSIAYDGSGLPTYIKPAGATATKVHYAGWAQADSVWGDGQPRQRMWIGASGRVDSVETGASGSATRMRYKYDARGRVTAVRDPLQHTVDSADYGGTNGNTWKTIRSGNRITTYGYDLYGRVISIAVAGMPTRTIQYDAINRVTQVYDGVNSDSTRYWYDVSFGSFTKDSVVDPKDQVYKFSYDRLGRLISRQHPSGHVVAQYQYSKDGELKRVTNARGQDIDFSYDALHRLMARSGAGIAAASFSYSANHRVVTSANDSVTETAYLNERGAPDSVETTMAGHTYVLRYGYTSAGLHDSTWGSGVSVGFLGRKYLYNTALGVLNNIRLNGGQTAVGLNADLQPSTMTFPGGDQVIRGFIGLHHQKLIQTTAPYNDAIERKLTYDGVGRLRRQLHEPWGDGRLFGYDGLGRLVADSLLASVDPEECSTTGPDPNDQGAECNEQNFWLFWEAYWVDSFAYDSAGNRTDRGGSYGLGNRIQAFDNCTYTTDEDGNVTQRSCAGETVTIAWNADNRPNRFTVNGTTIDLFYDPAGRLVQRNVNGARQAFFLWDGDNLFAELDGSGEKRTEYSYYPGLDNPHAVIKGSTPYYAHKDGLGNVVALSNSAQQLAMFYAYDAWGQPLTGGGADSLNNRARFKGALWLGPEAEFYYMRNRWYEPKTGRFLSEDPLGLDAGINLYTFAGNDVVNGRDPMGLRPCEEGELGHFDPVFAVDIGPVTRVEDGRTTGEWERSTKKELHRCRELGDRDGLRRRFRASHRAYRTWVRGSQRQLEGMRRGEMAELRCTASILWAEANLAMDVTGVKTFWGLARAGVGAVRVGLAWSWRTATEGVYGGAPLALAEAAAAGQLNGRDVQYATGVALLGPAGTLIPGISSGFGIFGAVNACGGP